MSPAATRLWLKRMSVTDPWTRKPRTELATPYSVNALARPPQRRRIAGPVLVFVRHRYPCTTTRTTPVTMMLAIANGKSTFHPSLMSMS